MLKNDEQNTNKLRVTPWEAVSFEYSIQKYINQFFLEIYVDNIGN